MSNTRATYKIRQVIELTGTSEFLLRVWENRYSAFTPTRTKTGRRLYTEADILKVRALSALTKLGLRVGDIAHLSLSELNELLSLESVSGPEANPAPHVGKIMNSAKEFNWEEARSLISQASKGGKYLDWIKSTILPLLGEISRQVDAGHVSIAQEHILSAIIKESLASRLQRKTPIKNGPRIVISAPEGDFHDIGISVAAHIAAELRANTLFLGPNMPKEELAAVCIRYKATHLVISSTAETKNGAKDEFLTYLNFLDRNLKPGITLWVAGRNASKYSMSLERPFRILESFGAFEEELKKCLK